MKVPLRPGTKVVVSGHPAVLTDDYQFDFEDLSTTQAVGESLRNDAHNFGLNLHLHIEPESQSIEPWIVYDEETETVSAPGFKTDIPALEVVEPKQKVTAKPAPKKKKATSKPVVGSAKTKAKKGTKTK